MTLAVFSSPDVTDRELKVRRRPIFILTLHVRKNRMCHRGVWKAGWQFPNVTRPELKVCGMAFFILTLHVGKPEAATQGREVPQRVRNRFGTTTIERQKRAWSGGDGGFGCGAGCGFSCGALYPLMKAIIEAMSDLLKDCWSPVRRFFIWIVPAAISVSPQMDRNPMCLRSA